MSTTLVIPDPHLPFNLPLDYLAVIKEVYAPDTVIIMGDLVDFYAFSRFDKDVDAMPVNVELERAREALYYLYKLFPKAIVLLGNHEMRLYKLLRNAGIPKSIVKTLHSILDMPKKWILTEKYQANGITFIHGEQFSGRGALFKAIDLFRTNVVFGHLHSLSGIAYVNNGVATSWAACPGCLMDTNSYAAAYGKFFKDQPVHNLLIIEDGVPQLIPYEVDYE